MKIILTKTEIKQKGWFSWLFSAKFNMKINGNQLELRTKSSFIGFMINVSNLDVDIVFEVDNVIYNTPKTFELGEQFLKFDNPCFTGWFYFEVTDKNLMLHLENKKRDLKLTNLCKNVNQGTEFRNSMIDYEGRPYFINKETYSSSYDEGFATETLPPSWDRVIYEGRMLYVFHTIKTTYWHTPSYYTNILKQKVEAMEGILSNINFLSFKTILPLKINVKRGFILQSTAAFLLSNISRIRNRKLHVVFESEMGQDHGALLREFLDEAADELFNDPRLIQVDGIYDVNCKREFNEDDLIDLNMLLATFSEENFEYTDDNKGKNALTDEMFYTYLGIYIGLLLSFASCINNYLSLAFFENLLKRKYTYRHIQDPQYQKSVLWMLRNEVDDNIYPGVTQDNKEQNVLEIVYQKLFLDKRFAYEYVRAGFHSVIPPEISDIFTAEDLCILLTVDHKVDVDVLREYVVYSMCNEDTKEIKFLWEILATKDQAYMRKFLKFLTGSGSLPKLVHNYSFRIIIEKCNAERALLRASSCLNKLFIGSYDDRESMERIMDFSILNTEGFHKI